MSEFYDLERGFTKSICQICGGFGKINDAEPGDITCNFKPCRYRI